MRRTLILFTVVAMLLITTLAAAYEGKTQRVRFARGRTTAVLKGAVVRGTQDQYILGARSGQTMIVHITSLEKNAVFAILGPDGSALQGAEEGSDVTDWTGTLPMSGDFSIWVGPTRGNATYTLEITIR
jgi:type II secretory pathway pseudopilin PulG